MAMKSCPRLLRSLVKAALVGDNWFCVPFIVTASWQTRRRVSRASVAGLLAVLARCIDIARGGGRGVGCRLEVARRRRRFPDGVGGKRPPPFIWRRLKRERCFGSG
jgi:hypothetical protein